MRLYILSLSLVAVCIPQHTKAATFPAEIHRCHPGETDCIVQTANDLLGSYARKGLPAASFPVVEPFHLKKVQLTDGHSGSLNLKFSLRDVDVVGLSTVKFDRAVGFSPDPATSKFELYGSLPKLTIRSKYNADGRILILPIQGDGDADISFENVKFSTKFKPALHPKNGKMFLTVDKLKVLLEPQRMNIKLANLFNGDQALGSHMNQFLNENWSDVWVELQPAVQSTISDIIKIILDNMFKDFAYQDFMDI
ncbi:protein takeout [Stomoxys calcitrans]|uniref:Protein takeout n=1 Tax=Stomoxys calcitrans TaxID=35570 RepID=A0A1I8PU26_STOCA|nr:protein takeout [Stomoxys calcitrans]